MTSTDNNISHGAYHRSFVPVPQKDTNWLFTGLEGPQEVSKMKEIGIHDLRIYGLEKYLDKDITDLAPKPSDYDLKQQQERRQLEANK